MPSHFDLALSPTFTFTNALKRPVFLATQYPPTSTHPPTRTQWYSSGERLLELEPENALIHRLVLQLYDLSGISQESLKMKRSGKRSGPKEYLGYSWIEDRNIVHSFVSGGRHQLYAKFLLSYIRSIEVKTKAPKYRDRP
ncbi:Pentatricopeptide repeat-containing protein [Abeliophyllum distichum]|uniref:Pentatricopeptide repeat-containing protein n=1 Tax=Abeliophyllum distichum TaxID=126358 RepID=A0ABD1SDL2_9LAMI